MGSPTEMLRLLALLLAPLLAVAGPSAGEPDAAVAAPDFAYRDINPASPTHGETLRLSEVYAERGVVLNFLASWCGYCWKELPDLQRLHADGTVRVLGVAADEAPAPPGLVLSLVERAGLTMPILWVPPDESAAMEEKYGHELLPATYVIDRQGAVRRVLEGAVPRETLLEAVRRHLAPDPAAPPAGPGQPAG